MLRLRPTARDDLDAAARWYEAQEPGLGRQFLSEVRLAFQHIRSNPAAYPASYPASYRGTRRALIRRFPYGVVYLPVPEQDCSENLLMIEISKARELGLLLDESRPTEACPVSPPPSVQPQVRLA